MPFDSACKQPPSNPKVTTHNNVKKKNENEQKKNLVTDMIVSEKHIVRMYTLFKFWSLSRFFSLWWKSLVYVDKEWKFQSERTENKLLSFHLTFIYPDKSLRTGSYFQQPGILKLYLFWCLQSLFIAVQTFKTMKSYSLQ